MFLDEIFDHLLYGELSQTAITKNGAITTDKYAQLTSYVNLGVLALHKRFLLKEKEVVLQLYDHIVKYELKWIYASTNSGSAEVYKYILDTAADPFNSWKYLRILAMYDQYGHEYTLNSSYTDEAFNSADQHLAFTPGQLELQIPYPDNARRVGLLMLAAPLNITAPTLLAELATTEVDLPDILLDPLLAYIADRHFTSKPSILSKETPEAVVYPSRFERECRKIKEYNLINEPQITGVNRFWRNGWV